jgi:type I restriction enzyme S subunit
VKTMSGIELPANWCLSPISEITTLNPTIKKADIPDDLEVSFVPMSSVEAESGNIDVSSSRKFYEVKKGYTPFQEGDVLFAKITPCMENGKMAVVPVLNNHVGFGSTEFHVLRSATGINPKYIYFYVSSKAFRQEAEHNMTGAVGQKRVTAPYLANCEMPIPPTNEQLRIVAKIEALFSELDKGIESFKTVRDQLKIYRQALLKHAFSGKLTEQWQAENSNKLESAEILLQRIQAERQQRYQQQLKEWEANGKQGSKPKAPKTLPPLTAEELVELPELPEGWAWCKWENILDYDDGAFKRGPFGSALKKEFFVKNGYKVYEQYCPINDDCSFERYYVSDEKFKELESFAVRANDFLVSCSGVTLGRITQIPKDFKEGIINQALLRVRINSIIYDFTFFKTLFRSRFFQKRIFENSTGSAIPNVKGVNELKAIPVPICSLLEQQQIILELESRLSTLDQLDQTITTALQQAEALRQSILKKAFSGLLVPQDPNDEPASVLLERIQAEKAAQALQTKPKKTPKRKATT